MSGRRGRPDGEGCAGVWQVVRAIPRGRVATYGQVATLAGLPGAARHAGRCLAGLPEGADVPWQRVVAAGGRISCSPGRRGGHALQRALLESEGIAFDATGRLDLRRHLWRAPLSFEGMPT